MLDSEFMNLQDDFRPNNNFSCWPNGSFIELCLVQSFRRTRLNLYGARVSELLWCYSFSGVILQSI